MIPTGSGPCQLTHPSFKARLEHVAGMDLQIDAVLFHKTTGVDFTNWGEVKYIYQ